MAMDTERAGEDEVEADFLETTIAFEIRIEARSERNIAYFALFLGVPAVPLGWDGSGLF